MIKIMCFSFYPKLSTQRTYWLVTSRNYFGSDVINRFRLNALASTTAIDIYKRNLKKKNQKTLLVRNNFSLYCGCYCHTFACIGTLFENLIQLVNIIGSIFYGTVLEDFLVGFISKCTIQSYFFTVR
jgi:hypothetical protein